MICRFLNSHKYITLFLYLTHLGLFISEMLWITYFLYVSSCNRSKTVNTVRILSIYLPEFLQIEKKSPQSPNLNLILC